MRNCVIVLSLVAIMASPALAGVIQTVDGEYRWVGSTNAATGGYSEWGDQQGWRGTTNNGKGIEGSGGTFWYGGWMTVGPTPESAMNAGTTRISRAELQAAIDWAGPNWQAYLMIADSSGNGATKMLTINPVVGIFKLPAGLDEGAYWSLADAALEYNGVTYTRAAYGNYAARTADTNYGWGPNNKFDDFIVNHDGGEFDIRTTPGVDFEYVPGFYNNRGYFKVALDRDMVETYLADPSFAGFFASTQDAIIGDAGYITSNSGNQWSYGAGGLTLLVAVPEPATLTLLAMGGLALLRRRRS